MGETVLHYAAKMKDERACKTLLERGAAVNAVDEVLCVCIRL